eukprot:TRINITY_DN6306_c0_g1_i3.p2 TRINITY_DN6306_c0_g1~~TRINITY_DN6306_c0_g1_i3.p2  ORF type:complete len:381 (+),score=50.59 TRINITY_DN6306_c0_g1_i3:77-1144(+)
MCIRDRGYSTPPAHITIARSTFANNKADIGGAIYLTNDTSIGVDNSNFDHNNTARFFGPFIATEPHFFRLETNKSTSANNETVIIERGFGPGFVDILLTNVSSAYTKVDLKFLVYDKFSQLINGSDSNLELEIIPKGRASAAYYISNAYSTYENSSFQPQDVMLGMGIGQTRHFLIESNMFPNKPSTNEKAVIGTLDVHLRFCERGEEIFTDNRINGLCVPCPQQFYSLRNDSRCKRCPSDDALCPGRDKFIPKHGFWRLNENTTTVIKCPLDRACPGNRSDMSNQCSKGYKGILCATCKDDDGYGESASGKYCVKCSNMNWFHIISGITISLTRWIVLLYTIRYFNIEKETFIA